MDWIFGMWLFVAVFMQANTPEPQYADTETCLAQELLDTNTYSNWQNRIRANSNNNARDKCQDAWIAK